MKILWAIIAIVSVALWLFSRKFVIEAKKGKMEKSKKIFYYVICYGSIVGGIYSLQKLFFN